MGGNGASSLMKRFVLLILVASLAGGGYYAYRNQRSAGQTAQASAVSGRARCRWRSLPSS